LLFLFLNGNQIEELPTTIGDLAKLEKLGKRQGERERERERERKRERKI